MSPSIGVRMPLPIPGLSAAATLVLAELRKGTSLRRIDLMRRLKLPRVAVADALDELKAARLVLSLTNGARYQSR